MFSFAKSWLVLATIGFGVVLLVGDSHTAADFQLEEDAFDPNEVVGSLTVRLTLGAGGEALTEPVALDLGLGFPLWLHPLGRAEGEPAPYGAVPQVSSVELSVEPGGVAEFTFAVDEDAGQDYLQTSSQLLDGVRVSDISRIGFMSRGDSKWVLDAFEIEINGRPFVSNNALNASVDDAQQAALARLAELEPEMSPLRDEAEDIQLLVEVELASDEDLARLQEIEATLDPLVAEQNRLQRQLVGARPWYREAAFESPWRTGEPVNDVRISLVTASHAGAETQNYVYYRTGGHKYLLSSPMNPLAPENGMRVIPLDLEDGPLTAADLRGHALGMVAHPSPYGAAPDRWHPERLIVEVDGSIVYDSDENELDRTSLEAVRIIPPAHLGEAGEVVANVPVERETFVWFAGQGQGLDLVNGGALDLPNPDDEAFPEPEPGLPFDEEEYADAEYNEGFEDEFEPFPGEYCYEEEWFDWDPGMDPGGVWIDPIGWHDMGGTPWCDLSGLIEELIDMITGNPAGVPVQVENIRLVNTGGGWQVQWDVFGDVSQVTSYLVEILTVDLHAAPAPVGTASWGNAGAWQRQFPVPPGTVATAEGQTGDPLLAYLMPRVTPITAAGPEPGWPGAARALTELRGDTLVPIGTGAQCFVDLAPQPFGPVPGGSTAWNPGPCQTHTGFLLDAPLAGSFHMAMRVVPPVAQVEASGDYAGAGLFDGSVSIVGHVGFSDIGLAANIVDADMWLFEDMNVEFRDWPGVSNLSPQLTPFRVDFPPTAATALMSIWPRIQNNAIGDPQQPVVFFGLRAIRTGP